jgi:excisionase family DNA binding protein
MNSPNLHPDFMTVQEVADLLRVTSWTVRQWINGGRLRASRPPETRGWLIKRADAVAFAEAETANND